VTTNVGHNLYKQNIKYKRGVFHMELI